MKVIEYKKASEEKVSDPGARDVYKRVLIGPDDAAQRFYMRRFRVLAGGHTPFHSHDFEHEVFVICGRGLLQTSTQPRELSPGTVVFIPSGEEHQFRNIGEGDLEFLCLIPADNKA